MKAILINPEFEYIHLIDFDGDYKSIYKLLDCRMFECVYPFKNEDTVYVDEEGLLKDSNYAFTIKFDNLVDGEGKPIIQELYGNALILGSDDQGESVDCKTLHSEIRTLISFKGKVTISEEDRGFSVMPFDIAEALKNTEGNA